MAKKLEGRLIELLEYGGGGTAKSSFKCLDQKCGNTWKASAWRVASVGTGCPACSKTGFDPSKEAYFYAYKIQADHGEYLGFGITCDIKQRNRAHRNVFNKHGIKATLLFSHKAAGIAFQDFERSIKDALPTVNTGIAGFKTEALVWSPVKAHRMDHAAKLISQMFPQPAN